jgi:hypothetical protein
MTGKVKELVVKNLVKKYYEWLQSKTTIDHVTDHKIKITFPYLAFTDMDLAITVMEDGDAFILTDDGSTLQDMRDAGWDLNDDDIWHDVQEVLDDYSIKTHKYNNDLVVNATDDTFADRLYDLLVTMFLLRLQSLQKHNKNKLDKRKNMSARNINDCIFESCQKINDLLNDSNEKDAKEELVKLLNTHKTATAQIEEYTPLLNHLIRELLEPKAAITPITESICGVCGEEMEIYDDTYNYDGVYYHDYCTARCSHCRKTFPDNKVLEYEILGDTQYICEECRALPKNPNHI